MSALTSDSAVSFSSDSQESSINLSLNLSSWSLDVEFQHFEERRYDDYPPLDDFATGQYAGLASGGLLPEEQAGLPTQDWLNLLNIEDFPVEMHTAPQDLLSSPYASYSSPEAYLQDSLDYSSFQALRGTSSFANIDNTFDAVQSGAGDNTQSPSVQTKLVLHPEFIMRPCKHCSQSFKSKSELNEHNKSHRRHRCNEVGCGKSFTRSVDLERHKRGLHGMDHPFAQYVCVCEYTTSRKDNFERHKKGCEGGRKRARKKKGLVSSNTVS